MNKISVESNPICFGNEDESPIPILDNSMGVPLLISSPAWFR